MPGPHKKKTKGARVKKRKADSGKKAFRAEKGAAGGESGLGGGADAATDKAARQRNPKAFVFSGSGKAKKSAARTAEREQRRMHGEADAAERKHSHRPCSTSGCDFQSGDSGVAADIEVLRSALQDESLALGMAWHSMAWHGISCPCPPGSRRLTGAGAASCCCYWLRRLLVKAVLLYIPQ